MLKFFQNNNLLMLLLFPVLAGLFTFSISEDFITNIKAEERAFLYNKLLHLISGNFFIYIYKLLIAIFLTINGILYNKIIVSVSISKTKNWYYGFIFLIILGLTTSITDSLAIFIIIFFVLSSIIIIFRTLRKPIAVFDYLNAGMLFSIAFLFWENILYFVPIIFISLFILRAKLWRDSISAIIGLIIPFFIFVSIYFFITSNFNVVFEIFGILTKKQEPIETPYIYYFLGSFIVLFSIISFFKILFRFNSIETDKQDYYKIFFFIFIFSLIIPFIISTQIISFLPIIFIPLAIPFSLFFLSIRKKILSEILFDFFLIIVIVAQTGLLNEISF